MQGARSYKVNIDAHSGHEASLQVVDVGGFGYMWCPLCGTLTEVQGISIKHADVAEALLGKAGKSAAEKAAK